MTAVQTGLDAMISAALPAAVREMPRMKSIW
jgi:hypothetical protein